MRVYLLPQIHRIDVRSKIGAAQEKVKRFCPQKLYTVKFLSDHASMRCEFFQTEGIGDGECLS
jgi:hypothetical protein